MCDRPAFRETPHYCNEENHTPPPVKPVYPQMSLIFRKSCMFTAKRTNEMHGHTDEVLDNHQSLIFTISSCHEMDHHTSVPTTL